MDDGESAALYTSIYLKKDPASFELFILKGQKGKAEAKMLHRNFVVARPKKLPKHLRTVQSLFHNMADAKRNGATTFLSLYTTESTLFINQI